VQIAVRGTAGFALRLPPAIHLGPLLLYGELLPKQPVKQRQKIIHIACRVFTATVVLMMLIWKSKYVTQCIHGFGNPWIFVIQQIQIVFPVGVHMNAPDTLDSGTNGPGFHQAKIKADKTKPIIG
tara:strand:- start:99877 stop:100251 length:375 start_codon:yes stop_codon:yes gene_type:complete